MFSANVQCNLLMETVIIKCEVRLSQVPIKRLFLAVGYYEEESTDTDQRVSMECTPKSAVAHQLHSSYYYYLMNIMAFHGF